MTRQLRYSLAEAQRSLDIGLFINGLPVLTFELKNSPEPSKPWPIAVCQYREERHPHEKLFELGRCIAHFAVDDNEVRFCTHLQGKRSQFLPFNRGWNDGAGNPPNPNGIKSDYLWREVLARESLTDILENYAQVLEHRDHRAGTKKRVQIWPRYHQLDVVRCLLADVSEHGVGRRYLIQHSAGSGKSNSIAWLSHRLIGIERDGVPVFDSIIVVTDRLILDRQLRDTIRQYTQVSATLAPCREFGRFAAAYRVWKENQSFRRYRNSRSFSTRSATNTVSAALRSSSTRRIQAKAAALVLPCQECFRRSEKAEENETFEGPDQPPHGFAAAFVQC